MKKISDVFKIVLYIFLYLILTLFFIRFFSPREIDDVSPEIYCEKDYIKKIAILWVIPLFNNSPISENKEWCKEILSLNKTIGMHGVYHTYKELNFEIDEEYIKKGMLEFEKCFLFKPKIFKPSHLAISKNNKKIIKNLGIKYYGEINQNIHKVYHCSDTGRFTNKMIDLF